MQRLARLNSATGLSDEAARCVASMRGHVNRQGLRYVLFLKALKAVRKIDLDTYETARRAAVRVGSNNLKRHRSIVTCLAGATGESGPKIPPAA